MSNEIKYYRHLVDRFVAGDRNNVGDKEWRFTTLPPDEYVKDEEGSRSKHIAERGGLMVTLKVLITHEIKEDDYKARKIYTIPINQYVFGVIYSS